MSGMSGMSNAGGARPFVAQMTLRRRVVNEILLTLLNHPMTTDRRSPRYVPRRLRAPAPDAIALWWDAPAIAFEDPTTLRFTARLAGGVRQPEIGRMLTVSGLARARLRMEVRSDNWATPYLGLSVVALDLIGLAVSYAGAVVAASDEPPTPPDVRAPGSPLWRLVNDALITPLTRLPLSFVWSALTDWQGQDLRLDTATAHAIDPETIALTFASAGMAGEAGGAAVYPAPLDADDDCALTLSADGMTQLATRLLMTGALPQRLRDEAPQAGDVSGGGETTIEAVAVSLRPGMVSLIAQMRHDDGDDPRDASVTIDFTCEIDPRARLIVTPVDAHLALLAASDDRRYDARATRAEAALSVAGRTLALAFCRELPEVFGQRRPADQADYPTLPRQAALPMTPLTQAVTPTRVVVSEGALTIICAAPASQADGARFIARPPHRQPGVAIRIVPQQTPTDMPAQPGERAPVLLEAEVVTPSYPPYDYHWTTDTRIPTPQGEHTATVTLDDLRAPLGTAPQPTRAAVTLIDAFGQLARDAIRLPFAVAPTPPLASTIAAAPLALTPGVNDLPTLPGLAYEAGVIGSAYDGMGAVGGMAGVPAGDGSEAETYSSGSTGVWSDPERAAALAASASARTRRRRSRLLVALLALAALVIALSGFLALYHPSPSGVGTLGLGHGAGFNQTAATATATHAVGVGATTPGAQTTPDATTTAAPGATMTPAPGTTPTATVPPASTPTPTSPPGVTPTPPPVNPALSVNNTSNSQGCVVALVPPAAFTLTLTNDGVNTLNWQISITQVDGSGTTPWASANQSTGSLAPTVSTTITITPTAASCPGLLGSNTYFLTVTATNQDGSGTQETIEVDDVISDV